MLLPHTHLITPFSRWRPREYLASYAGSATWLASYRGIGG
jgi:hypothetical protein